MTIESKMSGWSVTDYSIINKVFTNRIITLKEVVTHIKNQKAMDYILDTFRFTKGADDDGNCEWYAIIDLDTIYKISILESYPEYDKELTDRFGDDWYKFYLRFGH